MVSHRSEGNNGGASQPSSLRSSDDTLESQDELAAGATDPDPPQRQLRAPRLQHHHNPSNNQASSSQSQGPEQQERATRHVDTAAKEAARRASAGPSHSPDHFISQATWQDIKREKAQLLDDNNTLRQDLQHCQRLYCGAHVQLIASNDRETDHRNTIARLRKRLVQRETQIQQTNFVLDTERNTRVQEKMEWKSELTNAKAEGRLWQKSLEECKERIFRIQPLEHTTDAKLAGQYKSLCDAIEDWADSHFGEFDNLLAGSETILWSGSCLAILEAWPYAGGEMKTVLDHPQAGSVMLRFFIFRYLHRYLLHEDRVCVGLPVEYEKLIRGIENGIRDLEPRRDEVMMGAWKADVQRALRLDSNVKSRTVEYLDKVNKSIGAFLTRLMPHDRQSSYEVQSFGTLSTECEDLAANIRLSNASYDFVFEFYANNPPESRILYERELRQYRVLNEATGQPIRGEKSVQVGVNGRVGEKLCVVHPAMIRRGKSGESGLTLVPATILVKLDMPEVRRGRMKVMETNAGLSDKVEDASTRKDGGTDGQDKQDGLPIFHRSGSASGSLI